MKRRFRLGVLTATAALGLTIWAGGAQGDVISGLNTGTFNLQGDTALSTFPNPQIDNGSGVLTLTNAGDGSQAGSAIYNAGSGTGGTVPIGTFTVSFVYQETSTVDAVNNNNPADGATFVIESESATAYGGSGGGLGYGASNNLGDLEHLVVTPSFAFEIDIYNPTSSTTHGPGGIGLGTNGSVGTYGAAGSIDFAHGDQIQVTLVYDGTDLFETLTDLTTGGTPYTSAGIPENIPGLVGADAWVGFTGSDGGGTATQTISDFSFTNAVAVPLPAGVGPGLGLLAAMGLAVVGLRRVAA